MTTREHRTPLSIWIIVVVWSLIGLAPTLRLVSTGASAVVSFTVLFAVAWVAYHGVALARLSRWPVVLTMGVAGWSIMTRYLMHYDWRAHYPMLGVFIILIPLGLYLSCTLPHWGKMNWAIFGRSCRPATSLEETFA
ncbi:MAG: hypothetical protein J7515_06820 [Caulobacter sp.]|nr:hypothetical protein [Caulobacter sp.]